MCDMYLLLGYLWVTYGVRKQQHPSQNGTTYEASNYCWHHSSDSDRPMKVQEQVLQP